ncbi:MAG: hypothetical protein RJA22_2987 [Verrucomicrobiota bacterium]|jgi:hypothetical protein
MKASSSTESIFSRFPLGGVLLGLLLAVGLVVSAMQVTRAWIHIADSQVITVTGSARQDVVSDLAVWGAVFATEANTMVAAQQKLKGDEGKVRAFLVQNGVTNAGFSAISIQRLKPGGRDGWEGEESRQTVGFRLLQVLRVESTNLPLVATLQQRSTALVEQGVELSDQGISYMYTRVGEAKVDLLAAATKDARQRAEQIASQGGRRLGSLRNARMGVFQITPRNSNDTSAEGINDTSSRDKSIRAVVSASFTME